MITIKITTSTKSTVSAGWIRMKESNRAKVCRAKFDCWDANARAASKKHYLRATLSAPATHTHTVTRLCHFRTQRESLGPKLFSALALTIVGCVLSLRNGELPTAKHAFGRSYRTDCSSLSNFRNSKFENLVWKNCVQTAKRETTSEQNSLNIASPQSHVKDSHMFSNCKFKKPSNHKVFDTQQNFLMVLLDSVLVFVMVLISFYLTQK